MTREEFFESDFLSQFKDSKDFGDFMVELYRRGVESMLEGELSAHLGYGRHQRGKNPGNSRNGHGSKTIKTEFGQVQIRVPRDRDASFEPLLVPKRARMSEGIESAILSLYARGMSNSDIEAQVRDLYGVEVSTSTISMVTDKVAGDILAWQNRPLESLYMVVWMDAIVFKVREESRVVSKAVHLAVGLRKDGFREVLGMWLARNESAAFWLSVLNDLKARGVRDALISVSDNLSGFTQAVKAAFPEAATQVCVVHQVRNSAKHVAQKHKKDFAKAMRAIYTAPNRDAARAAFDDFDRAWSQKYAYAVESWRRNWDDLTTFLDLPLEIRKTVYTTNVIENLNGKLRMYTRNKLSFPTDDALAKSVFLALRDITSRWSRPVPNWGIIFNQFMILFNDRITSS